MLLPARVKYRKLHRGRRSGVATQGNELAFGEFGLQADEAAWMTNRQMEAARRVMTRFVRRGGQVFIRIFPDKSYTKKPAETRMGKGKGAPEGWVAVIRPGRVLFEMEGVNESEARRAMQLASAKLPIKTKELDDQLFRMRIQKSMGQLEAPGKIRNVRRGLARVYTILKEKAKSS